MNYTKSEDLLFESITGEKTYLVGHHIKGSEGPHIHIQSSVHGSEIQGNAVILKLLQYLKSHKLQGSISLYPLANPKAVNQKVGTYTSGRFNPITGDNWNREYIDIVKKLKIDIKKFFKENYKKDYKEIISNYKALISSSLEAYISEASHPNKLNLILQLKATHSNGVLDFHTGPNATRYLYCPEYCKESAKMIGIPHNLMISNDFFGSMDEASFIHWIHLQKEFQQNGHSFVIPTESYTFEFGSEDLFSLKDADEDIEFVLNYLKFKGMLSDEPKLTETQYFCHIDHYKTIYAASSGLVEYKIEPGQHFKAGDLLYTVYQMNKLDWNDPIRSTKQDIFAKEDGIIINRTPTSIIHEGMEVIQMMTNIYAQV